MRKILISLLLLMTALVFTVPAAAADVGFSVTPVLPANQVTDSTGSYFDLLVEPGQTQDLTVAVHNSTDEEIVVVVEAFTASTNRNGLINYSSEGPTDETLQHAFGEMTAVRTQTIRLPAKSTEHAVVTMAVPEEPFSGVLLGSIQITKELTEEEKNSGAAIVNQYSYIVGVRLAQTQEEIVPDFALGEVVPGLENKRAAIVNEIRNTKPVIIKGMNAELKIYPKDSAEPVWQLDMPEVNMAPNSIFPFTVVDREGTGLQPGTYLSKIHLEYQGRTWNFEKEFVIELNEAVSINQNAGNLVGDQTAQRVRTMPLWATALLILGGLILLAVLVLVIIVLKRPKHTVIDLS